MPKRPQNSARLRIRVAGAVQGVGFRPFVYRLAAALGLGGFVANDPQGVVIEAQGPPDALEELGRQLRSEAPPLARVQSVDTQEIDPLVESGAFRIEASRTAGQRTTRALPDAATCADCLREIFDPADRRFRYPFTNCTHCGPRYSIVRAIPYDRCHTTMHRFEMCEDCRREYDSPADRRFHAQPNACPACGPRVWLTDADGRAMPGDALAEAARLLREGAVVAVKGLGGFHLACRADSDEAVGALRRRKNRDAKPFAVMAATPDEAHALAEFSPQAIGLLTSSAAPIVLAPRRPDAPVADLVAPGNGALGVMLPYTPLHHIILRDVGVALVMTSGNPAEEPLCRDNDEALRRLGHLADSFLLHDRDIERPIDDSVYVASSDSDACAPPWTPLRRARGYVPEAIAVSPPAERPAIALGGEMKSAVCFLHGAQAVLSEHLGELGNPAAYRNFIEAADRLRELLQVDPQIVACDLHPGYASTRHARALAPRPVAVQHHHAHIAAAMAENGIEEPTVGIVADGTGYGTDGTIWGCEILVADLADFQRAGHLAPYALPGGDAAARDTWRPALAQVLAALGPDWQDETGDCFAGVDTEALELAAQRCQNPSTGQTTSSLGRLFDAVAFLLGICDDNSFEARAAMALEAQAMRAGPGEALPFEVREGEPLILDPAPMVRAIFERRRRGDSPTVLARAFHETLAAMLSEAAARVSERTGIRKVALSGGCMLNRVLVSSLAARLSEKGLEALWHRATPAGDGGVALGQAVVAAARDRLGLVGDEARPRT